MARLFNIGLLSEYLSRLVWEETRTDGEICLRISEPVPLNILRATWKRGDERLFIISNDTLYLDVEDVQYINHFPGLEVLEDVLEIESVKKCLRISGRACRALGNFKALHTDKNIECILIPCSARGNQGFAFGHFISEVIPDILILQAGLSNRFGGIRRLLVYPMDCWAKELVEIFGISHANLIEMPEINSNSYPEYSAFQGVFRFYEVFDRCRYNSLQLMHKLAGQCRPCNTLKTLVFLTRDSAGASRPKRWLDLEDCYTKADQSLKGITVKVIDPAERGPRSFRSEYGMASQTIFIAAPGSAIYNALLLSACSVILPVECLPAEHHWSGQVNDLRPYNQRIAFITTRLSTHAAIRWDEPFNLGSLPDASFFSLVYKYLLLCRSGNGDERFIVRYASFYLSLPLTA